MKYFITTVLKILNKKEKTQLITAILFDLVIGILDIAFLAFLLLVINFYTTNTINRLPLQSLFNKNSLLLICLFFMLFSLKNWLGYQIAKSQYHFFYAVASRLSQRNMMDYLNDSYLKFTAIDSSVYIRKISQQPIEFSNYILTNIQLIISQSILILFTIIGLLFYHASLFFSLFILLVPPVILLAFFIKKKLKEIRTNSKKTSQMTLQYLKESLGGYVESNVYEKNDFFSERYHSHQKQLNDYIATQQTLQGLPSRLIEVFAVLGFFILIAINKYWANTEGVGLLDIGVFMAASYKIIPGIVKILNSSGQIKTYEFTLKDLLPSETTLAQVYVNPVASIRSIKFNSVDFSFGNQQVLSNFNFEISPGDFVGVSARSGFGKTTITNLLLGFLEQDKGTISVNGNVVDNITRQSFWKHISYVKQQPFFINDTLAKNITLTDQSFNGDKLTEVIAFCGIQSMLDKYPEGINILITENGKNISGGQRQRLMLARALYHDFDLLILDEPFGEVDETSEKDLLSKLQLLAKKGKMIIMITHNKTGLSFCNQILSLDGE